MINFRDKKVRKIFSSIIIVMIVLSMILPMVLGALSGAGF